MVILFVEDGAVGWSCKCSSGRHCRRIGGHRSRDRARPSCSLSRGHNLRLASPGPRIQAARGLEFCVLGIVVHLRLGNCIGYSLREGCSGDSCICHTLALNRSCVQSLLASMCGPKACSLCVLPRAGLLYFGLYIHNGGESRRAGLSYVGTLPFSCWRGCIPWPIPWSLSSGSVSSCIRVDRRVLLELYPELLLPSPHGLLPLLQARYAPRSCRSSRTLYSVGYTSSGQRRINDLVPCGSYRIRGHGLGGLFPS